MSRSLVATAAVGAATMGGVFFAFSTFVMSGLDRLPPAQGIAAMQSLNVTAVRPAFMTALFGTGALCVYLGVRGVLDWGDRRAALLVVGSAVYLGGAILLTAVYHVPMNDTLATVNPHAAGAASDWSDYVDRWTAANHIRTAASVGSAAAFVGALMA